MTLPTNEQPPITPRKSPMPNYNYWQAALAGEKPRAIVDQCELGFYRKGVYQRDGKGNNKRVGWQPVAVFMNGDVMTARVGNEADGRDITGDELGELWSFIAGQAISEGNYREVAEHGKRWWDAPAPPEVHVPGVVSNREPREITNADNNPPEVLTDKDHGAAIDNAIAAAIKIVTNEAEAAQALGSKNRIAELRLAADKAGKALYDPPFREYKRLHGAWSPMIAKATAAETALNRSILTFREKERQRVAAEQAAAVEAQRIADEASERAAQRAIAAGVQEPAPEAIEIEQPAAPVPIQPTYGTRKIKEELHTILDAITDYDAVYNFLKAEPKVKALLLELATAKVKAGFAVPGVVTRQGLI